MGKKFFFCCLLLFLLVSCGEKENPFIDPILGSKKEHFRGVKIGTTPEEVKDTETSIPEDEEADYLYYHYELEDDNYFSISYSFDKKGLYEIQVDIYLESDQKAHHLFNEFKEYYQSNYGQPKKNENAFVAWRFTSDHSDEIELSLINESTDYEKGKLTINFYDYDY